VVSLPDDLPIVDHHCHLSPSGEGVAAAARFAKVGGTHLFLTTQQYGAQVPTRLEQYREQFEITERLAMRIQSETGVVVYVVIAPFPVDLISASAAIGLRPAVELQLAALDVAGKWVEEERAVALGEVGRPHFPIDPGLRPAVEEVFRHALEVARDAGCPAVVHSEDLTAEGFGALAEFAVGCSFPLDRLVKHYAREVLPLEARRGVAASYVARRSTVHDALGGPGPWFLETDFLDDPRRPGAVLDLVTIPRRARALVEEDPSAVERLRIPFIDSVEQVYGFRPGVPAHLRS
jgi:TatD-related deoxyribonuclease